MKLLITSLIFLKGASVFWLCQSGMTVSTFLLVLFAVFLPPLRSLSQGGLGDPVSYWWQPYNTECPNAKQWQLSQVFSFLWRIQLLLLFIFYHICLFISNAGQQGAFVLCPEPKWYDENANGPWQIQNSPKNELKDCWFSVDLYQQWVAKTLKFPHLPLPTSFQHVLWLC